MINVSTTPKIYEVCVEITFPPLLLGRIIFPSAKSPPPFTSPPFSILACTLQFILLSGKHYSMSNMEGDILTYFRYNSSICKHHIYLNVRQELLHNSSSEECERGRVYHLIIVLKDKHVAYTDFPENLRLQRGGGGCLTCRVILYFGKDDTWFTA
jgi:hypothetical protein